ncbi:MAG TPA: hypothetical protein VGC55_06555 [Dokdonella sp.]
MTLLSYVRLPLVASLAALATLATGATTAPPIHTTPVTHVGTSTKVALHTLSDGTLYDQLASGNVYGAFVNDVLAPPPTIANSSVGADDFVVGDAAGWTITSFVFSAFGPGMTVPPAITLNVYADDGAGRPAATAACSAAATPVSYVGAPTYQITAALATPCALPAGTYWVAWSFDDVDLTSGVWGWWGQGSTLHNQPALWWNPGGNLSESCSANWSPFADCGIYDASLQDFGFAVVGHVNGDSSGLSVSVGLAPFGGDPNECGSASSVEVNVGDQVNVCYTLSNGGTQSLAYQSLVDSVDGAIVTYDPTTIAPGQSHSYVRTIVATGDSDRTASWTGYAQIAGYAYDDSAAPDFIDISGSGTDTGIINGAGGSSDPNNIGEVTADFPLSFYGQTSTALCLSADGLILFADPTCAPPSPGTEPPPGYAFNQSIPVSNVSLFGIEVPTILAPYWMNFDNGPGRLYTQTLGTAPNRTFVVQWNDVYSYVTATVGATFEVVFSESSPTIRYEYQSTGFGGNGGDDGAWATVGLQGDPNGLYTSYSYSQPSLHANSAIHWNYTASVSSSADSGSVHISAGDPTLAVAQTQLSAVVAPGATATRTLSIANSGNRDLHWNLGEAPGGSSAHFPKTPRYVAPAASATPSLAPRSLAGARSAQRPAAGGAPHAIAGGGFAVPAYGVSSLLPGLVNFDALDPAGSYTPINDSTDWIYAAGFIGNDFSKLWVIIDDSWDFQPGTYGTIDVATGEFTSHGVIAGGATSSWAGLVQDPLTGTVYSANFLDAPGSANATLYSIDLDAGQASRIGAIDGPGVNPVRYIPSIAISPAGLMYGLDLYGQSLLAIDKSSGAASVIESLGLNVQFIQSFAFDNQSGDLYWAALYVDGGGNTVGEMRVIDPLTAASQAIGAFPPAGEFPIDEMSALAIAKPALGCAAPGDVPWLTLSPTSGTIAAGGDAQSVTVSLDATGLSDGLHQATICVFSDDPRHRAIPVQVAFAVTSETPLYDQTVADTSLHAFNNTIVAPPETEGLSAEGADDFVISGNGWSVTGFQFTAYGNGDNPLPPTVNVRILADNGSGRPADEAICSASGVSAIALDAANQIGVFLPAVCDLPAGTYWVAWSFANVNIASPILGFWGATTELHNQPALWHNPGGMLGSGCSDWSTFDQCPSQFDASAKDFSFSVLGTVDTLDCSDVVFADGFDAASGGCAKRAKAD